MPNYNRQTDILEGCEYMPNFLDITGKPIHVYNFLKLLKNYAYSDQNNKIHLVDLVSDHSEHELKTSTLEKLTCGFTFETKWQAPIELIKSYIKIFPQLKFSLFVIDKYCYQVNADGTIPTQVLEPRAIEL